MQLIRETWDRDGQEDGRQGQGHHQLDEGEALRWASVGDGGGKCVHRRWYSDAQCIERPAF